MCVFLVLWLNQDLSIYKIYQVLFDNVNIIIIIIIINQVMIEYIITVQAMSSLDQS